MQLVYIYVCVFLLFKIYLKKKKVCLRLMCCICKEKSGQVSVTGREKEGREERDGRLYLAIKSRTGVYNCDAE